MENGEIFWDLDDTLIPRPPPDAKDDPKPFPGVKDFLTNQNRKERKNFIFTNSPQYLAEPATKDIVDAISTILTREDAMRSPQPYLGGYFHDKYNRFGLFYWAQNGQLQHVLQDYYMKNELANAIQAAGMDQSAVVKFFLTGEMANKSLDEHSSKILRNARNNPFQYMKSLANGLPFNTQDLYINEHLAQYSVDQESWGLGIIEKDMILGRALLRQRGHLGKDNDGRRSVMVGNEPDISASISDGGRTPVVVISTTEGLIEANQKKVALVLDALLGINLTSSRESYDTIFGSGVTVTMPFPVIGNLIGRNEIRKSTICDIPFTLVRGVDPGKECRTIVLNPQSFSTQMLELYTQK